MKATYIKLQSGKLFVSGEEEPYKSHYVIDDDGLERYASAMDFFNESFIESENRLIIECALPSEAFEQGNLKDGLYPVEGIQFRLVSDYSTCGCKIDCRANLRGGKCTAKKVAIVSLIEAKEITEKSTPAEIADIVSDKLMDVVKESFAETAKNFEPSVSKEKEGLLPSVNELKPFLYWVFHTADRIYIESTLGWRDNAIEEMYEAYKRRKDLKT